MNYYLALKEDGVTSVISWYGNCGTIKKLQIIGKCTNEGLISNYMYAKLIFTKKISLFKPLPFGTVLRRWHLFINY